MDETQNDENLTAKERAKKYRRLAYQKAKERQKNNPQYIAAKERAKEKRRELYQQRKQYLKDQKNKATKHPPEEETLEPSPEPCAEIKRLSAQLRLLKGGKS